MIDDRVQPRIGESSLAQVPEVACDEAAVLREVDDRGQPVGAGTVHAGVGAVVEGVVLVPGEKHHFLIRRADVELDVMRQAIIVGVGEAGQGGEGENAHPVVHVHDSGGGGIEGIGWGIHGGAEGLQTGVIVA